MKNWRPGAELARPNRLRFCELALFAILLAFGPMPFAYGQSEAGRQIHREDFQVAGEAGIQLFVREVVAAHPSDAKPLLLIHGARVPGVASFDLQVPGGSLAADLAQRGFAVYVMDLRGYGGSTRPEEMNEPPKPGSPLVRSSDAARDIGSVIDWIRQRRHVSRVALLGWATGGQWAGYYASIYSDKVSGLVMLNSLYGGSSEHAYLGHGTDLEDAKHPGQYNEASCGTYRFNTEKSLFGVWDKSIPLEDKTAWRDPAVASAYAKAALASDPKSGMRTPPSFRSPCGALEDSFYMAIGRQLWDASLIRVPTLVIASERDFWSRPADRETLATHLVHAPRVKVVVIPNATHFVHLDRADRGRDRLLEELTSFLLERPASQQP